MAKTYNTPKYRADKRIVSFVNPKTKNKIETQHKKSGESVSSIVRDILEAHFGA